MAAVVRPVRPGGPGWHRRGNRLLVVRVPRLGWSTRVHARAVLVSAGLVAVATATFVWSLAVGDYPVPVGDVVATLLGRDAGGSEFIVRTLRLPRGLTAVLVGTAFGVSGAVFQRLVRNPLASPDVVGVNAGAAVAAAFVVVIRHGSGAQVTAAALLGALGTALAVYALAYRRGMSGYRLVLVGIGITALLVSATHYLLTRAEIYEAQRAFVWLTGSLNGRGWEHVRPLALALALLVPAAIALDRHLRALELGDDTARALGARIEPTKAALLLVGAALAAAGTAAAGPIGFVALAAPQIARRLTGGVSGHVAAAACGAGLLVLADLVGRRAFAPTEIPVGIVTGVVGGPYLLFLLARANRIGSGG